MKSYGIDLAGKAENPSGFARLVGRRFDTELLYTDEEIIGICTRERPRVVAIDSPLSTPRRGSLRAADRRLIERGLRVFPPTFAGMRSLTERGIRIAAELQKRNLEVIEIHPRSSGLVLFGSSDRRFWVKSIQKKGWRIKPGTSEHEVDAALAALTGALYLRKKTEAVGEKAGGTIIIPIKSFEEIFG